jgi:hypothetical protein
MLSISWIGIWLLPLVIEPAPHEPGLSGPNEFTYFGPATPRSPASGLAFLLGAAGRLVSKLQAKNCNPISQFNEIKPPFLGELVMSATLKKRKYVRFLSFSGLVVSFHCVPVCAHDTAHPLQNERHTAVIEAKVAAVNAAFVNAKANNVPQTVLSHAEAVYWAPLVWRNSHIITVCFWNGTEELRKLVKDKVQTWTLAANIHFDFENAPGIFRECKDTASAQIRVSLDGHDPRKLYVNDDDRGGAGP